MKHVFGCFGGFPSCRSLANQRLQPLFWPPLSSYNLHRIWPSRFEGCLFSAAVGGPLLVAIHLQNLAQGFKVAWFRLLLGQIIVSRVRGALFAPLLLIFPG